MVMKKFFLAWSAELKGDGKEFEIFISRKHKEGVYKGFFLSLVIWEDFLDAVFKSPQADDVCRTNITLIINS
jgi:hypothetical protein